MLQIQLREGDFQVSTFGCMRRNLIKFPSIGMRDSGKIGDIIQNRPWQFPMQNSQTLFPWNFYKQPATSPSRTCQIPLICITKDSLH